MATSEGLLTFLISNSNRSLHKTSSASTKNTKSPVNLSKPLFLANPGPEFLIESYMILESFFAYICIILNESSIDPSSMSIISKFSYVCSIIESKQSFKYDSEL